MYTRLRRLHDRHEETQQFLILLLRKGDLRGIDTRCTDPNVTLTFSQLEQFTTEREQHQGFGRVARFGDKGQRICYLLKSIDEEAVVNHQASLLRHINRMQKDKNVAAVKDFAQLI